MKGTYTNGYSNFGDVSRKSNVGKRKAQILEGSALKVSLEKILFSVRSVFV